MALSKFLPQKELKRHLEEVGSLLASDLPPSHNQVGAAIDAINKLHTKHHLENLFKRSDKTKLIKLYSAALAKARKEEDIICEALGKIHSTRKLKETLESENKQEQGPFNRSTFIKALDAAAHKIPLWIGTDASERAPPLCGAAPAAPGHIFKKGAIVAAMTKSAGNDSMGFLAKVVDYHSRNYELVDICDEKKASFKILKRGVIPLPLMRANPMTNPEVLHQKGDKVLAVFPQTTSIYKGVIHAQPAQCLDDYDVVFEDKTLPGGFGPPIKVPQGHVLATRGNDVK